jgi:tyrosine-protein phosphatase SIW14
MPRFLSYAFAGIIMGVLVGVPVTYCTWRNQNFRNFHVVRDGVLYRSGQLSQDGLRRILHDHGIKTVVTLRYPPSPDKPAPDQEEENICREMGLHYFRLRHLDWNNQETETADRGVPAEANVQQFLDIMKDPRNHPVLVHCFAGIHRTGAMCAVYRMEFEHWSAAQAMQEMRDLGYVAHHQDVFSYLEGYRPRGYALGKSDEPSPRRANHLPVHFTDEVPQQPSADSGPWANRLFSGAIIKDFGTVAKGTLLKHSFKMTNPYKVPLEIVNVRFSCGCIAVEPKSRILQPNETTDLHVRFDTRRVNGPKSVAIFVTVGPQYVSTATLLVRATSIGPEPAEGTPADDVPAAQTEEPPVPPVR